MAAILKLFNSPGYHELNSLSSLDQLPTNVSTNSKAFAVYSLKKEISLPQIMPQLYIEINFLNFRSF